MRRPDPLHDPEEEAWAPFDAALRGVQPPGAEASLLERCLPPASTTRTVLVVDDEPNIRRLIEHHLTVAGYRVLLARDGLEALDRVQAGRAPADRPDLIILDVMMPGPDGFRVLEVLKMDPRTGEIPVIMLTALGGDDSIRRGWQTGTDCYLAKPFNPSELVTLVRRMVDVLGTPENPPPLRPWLK